MPNEIEDKIKSLMKKRQKEIKKIDDLIKSSSSKNIEELRGVLKKCQDIKDEIDSLLPNPVSALAGGEKQFSISMAVNHLLYMAISEAQRKLGEIMLGKLEGSSMENELRSFKTPIRSRKKVGCRFCEKPLYDETVSLCSSCVRFKSKKDMLEYRDSHPGEVDREGRLKRFPDLGS
jgi:hypothetical protein